MRILHTGDWHLGDVIGRRRIDRTDDLHRAVERVMAIARSKNVDVLLIAGDIFSDKANRQDDISREIEFLGSALGPFMRDGGTVLAITGNHDKEIACQLLRHTLALADPTNYTSGSLLKPGRLYLATGPTFYRLADRDGAEVQFLMMPYPTAARYLSGQTAGARDQVNRQLGTGFVTSLQRAQAHPNFRTDLPTILAAHVHVQSARWRSLFRITESDDVVLPEIPAHFAYAALGHIHVPQELQGLDHIRYCGSIERLDLGEREDTKSVAVVEIGTYGRVGAIEVIPLDATSIHHVEITDPDTEVPKLRDRYPDHETALVRYVLHWRPGVHHRDDLLRQIEETFPRCYDREVIEAGRTSSPTRHDSLPADTTEPAQIVVRFLEKELQSRNFEHVADVLALARELIDTPAVARARQRRGPAA